jgi:plastocyanin
MARNLTRSLAALTVALILAACGGDDGGGGGDAGGAATGGDTVSVVDNEFEGGDLAISVGDTVTWTHDGEATHTVTADDGTFDSGDLASGESFEHTFDEAGEFDYICEIHPSMTGTITVS